MDQLTLRVPGISCGHCKASIEGALTMLAGIKAATVDVKQKTVEASFDESLLDRTRIVAAIEEQGYDVEA